MRSRRYEIGRGRCPVVQLNGGDRPKYTTLIGIIRRNPSLGVQTLRILQAANANFWSRRHSLHESDVSSGIKIRREKK